MMYYGTAYWIKNCRKSQNAGHYRQKSCNKTLENDDVLQLLCQNACLFYRGGLFQRILSCNIGSPVKNCVWVQLKFIVIYFNDALKLWFRTGSFQ